MTNYISSAVTSFNAFNYAQAFLDSQEAEKNIVLGNQVLEGGGDQLGVSTSQAIQVDSLICIWDVLQGLCGKEKISFKRHFFFLMVPFILLQINDISKNHAAIYQKLSLVENGRVDQLALRFLRCDEASTKKKIFKLVERQTKKLMDCLGVICVTAFVVMNIALFYLGSRIYPVISLGLMGLASLEKYKIQSGLYSEIKKIQKTYLRFVPLILYPLVIIQEKRVLSKFMKMVGFGLSLNALLKDYFSSKNYRNYESKDDEIHDLTPDQFLAVFPSKDCKTLFENFHLLNVAGQDQYSNLDDCVVRREHVLIRDFPTVKNPKEKIPQVMSCWDKVVWKDHIQEIDKAIKDFHREAGFQAWLQEQEDSSEKKIAYVRALLEKLVSDIKDKTISVGDPLDYTNLQNQLGYIGENISQVDTDLQRQVLLSLALEGGDVCGTGIYEQVWVAANRLLMTSHLAGTLSLKRRILLQLRQEREKIAHALYLCWHKVSKPNSPEDNVHDMSLFKLMFALDFGIEDEGSRNDVTLRMTAFFEEILERVISRWLPNYQRVNAENLWEDVFRWQNKWALNFRWENEWALNKGYTPERIFQTIKDSINNGVITRDDFNGWLKEWMIAKAEEAIEAENLSSDEKAARKGRFEERLLDLNFQQFIGSVRGLNECCLVLMLVDIGVLSIKKRESVLLVNAEGDFL